MSDADSTRPAKHRLTRVGKYEITRFLEKGGMGVVFEARHLHLERRVALKMILPECNDPEYVRRFFQEARAAGDLRHPHIVTVYDLDLHEGQPFIAMEFLPGGTLADLVRKRQDIPLGRKLQMIEQTCAGLGAAHRAGIVHRDIKPVNIMLDAEGQVRIVDFGIARLAYAPRMSKEGMVIGTPNYMSPEQLRGERDLDHRTDIFSLGAVLYELLTYRLAFSGATLTEVAVAIQVGPTPRLPAIAPDVDADLQRIISTALEKERDRRYADMGAMARDLERLRRRVDDHTEPRPIPPPPKRSRVVLGVAAAALAGIIGFASWKVLDRTPDTRPPAEVLNPGAVTGPPPVPGGSSSTPTTATGVLIVDAIPWAEVTEILDASGNRRSIGSNVFTPVALALPAGEYTLTLRHKDARESKAVKATVVANQTQTLPPVEVIKIDANAYFKSLNW